VLSKDNKSPSKDNDATQNNENSAKEKRKDIYHRVNKNPSMDSLGSKAS